MCVLVTGAAGFLGKHVCASLLAQGKHVVGVDTFITADQADLRPLRQHERFTFAPLDVRGPEFPEFAARFPLERIYHLACPTGVPNLVPLALDMLETSYAGTQAALELARAHGAPLVLASSAEVYGDPAVVPQDEDYTGNVDTLGPRNGYEEGKRVAETLVAIYVQRYGVHGVIARIFNTYGPGMHLRDTRVVPAFLTAALSGRPLRVHGDGAQTRCHAFAGDIVAGLHAAGARGRPGRAYNLGGRDEISILTLAQLVRQVTASRAPIEFVGRPAHDHTRRRPAIDRARRELGWTPRTSLHDGLARTAEDFRARLNAVGGK